MKRTRLFRFLAFITYLPLPLLGIMLIFGVLGKLMHVGWLESAPGVLLIPMLITYYTSLIWGAVRIYKERRFGLLDGFYCHGNLGNRFNIIQNSFIFPRNHDCHQCDTFSVPISPAYLAIFGNQKMGKQNHAG